MKSSPFKKVGEVKMEGEIKKIDDSQFGEISKLKGGTIPGFAAIPMGIYNRYKDYKKSIQEQGPQTSFDKQKIQSYKFSTEK